MGITNITRHKQPPVASRGFTIVELLVVIVVIGVLAALTITAYSQVQQRARTAAASTALVDVRKKLEAFRIETGNYPASLSLASVVNSEQVEYEYATTGTDYCITARHRGVVMRLAGNSPEPVSGGCEEVFGLIGYWQFDGNANDASGKANHGTAVNVTAVPGRGGSAQTAYQFTGSSSYVQVANPLSQPVLDQEWSVAAWIKLPTGSPNSSQILVGGINSGVELNHVNRGLPLLYLNSGSDDYYVYGTQDLRNGVWTHVTYVFRNSDGLRKIYVNGTDASGSGPNYTSTPSGLQAMLMIGSGVQGIIDEVRIYERPLRSEEIRRLYEQG